MEKNSVIAGYKRSPFHFASKGSLSSARPDDLAASVIRELLSQSGIDPADIEDLILGCAFPEGEQGFNMARLVVNIADLPISIAGTTVNRFCGSSMQAIHMAAGAIMNNAGDAFICAGVESMSRFLGGLIRPILNFRTLSAGLSEWGDGESPKQDFRTEQKIAVFRNKASAAQKPASSGIKSLIDTPRSGRSKTVACVPIRQQSLSRDKPALTRWEA
jgi:acetyl-CoA acyltransferase